MRRPRRGEVWLVDLGLAAKIRPGVVLGVPLADEDRALVTVVPHTTSLRGTRYEVPVPVPFLRSGAFDAQGMVTVPIVRLMRPLGTLSPEQLQAVVGGVCSWLGINIGSEHSAAVGRWKRGLIADVSPMRAAVAPRRSVTSAQRGGGPGAPEIRLLARLTPRLEPPIPPSRPRPCGLAAQPTPRENLIKSFV